MTGIQDGAEHGPDSATLWSRTVLLAKACLEASQRRTEPRSTKHQKASPVPPVEIRADLFVNSTSGAILRAALRGGGSLRLRCRDFHAEELSLGGTLDLLEALEPLGLRRVELRFNNLGLAGLCQVVPRLSRFPDLASVRLPYSNVDVRRSGMEDGLRELAEALGWLSGLRELNLGSCRLAGRLRLLLGGLKVLLEGTLPLSSLRLVVHPYPVDGRDGDGDVPEGGVAALQEELRGMLRGAGRDEEVWTCSLQHHGGFDFFEL
uniref:Leucine-rich repeat-containing protein 14 n=1 Tax=Pavo cristatus TaxID=9049 RepID=A0A8C9LD27_PAVCR